jgi:L-iditol 2-dehydrogenase
MKHVYPRAIRLVESGAINVNALISHRFPLAEAPQAFALNDAYRDQVVKVVIDVNR